MPINEVMVLEDMMSRLRKVQFDKSRKKEDENMLMEKKQSLGDA